ncbi:hypothetical protein [Tengunoibacter tsumagoiensis]|uniref:Uncharacterized protein n=1 Tax=Tengunoibacter tsumagoiensis TaxID=2014871 RepID=A0A402A4H1_9CHLR|nr:hypothetical protein [Tengunoibacter tsumagoiensis]GCE14038.1 hypothetical protein KTT_38970 [Tengunoibacter tsumagoiensis]
MLDCLHSMAPNDEELLRYVLDEKPLATQVKSHVEHCVVCQQRLSTYAEMDQRLVQGLYRSQCPTPTELSLYCAQQMSVAQIMQITDHVKMCPLCGSELELTRRFLQSDLFPEPVQKEALKQHLQRIIASLVPWQPVLVTRREEQLPTEARWPRQYRADAINLSLHLSRASSGEAMLLGLITSSKDEEAVDEFEGRKAELYLLDSCETSQLAEQDGRQQNERALLTSYVDDLGNLVFKAVPTGAYRMIVHLPTCEMVINNLRIEYP